MRQQLVTVLPIVVAVGIILVVLAVFLIFQEMKPLVLRNPDGDFLRVAKDADAATLLFASVLDPENPELLAQADAVIQQKRVVDLPNRIRVTLVGRRYYKNGRMRENSNLKPLRDEHMKDADLIVERVVVLNGELKGTEVWVDSRYCKKKMLPF